ncbi:MAG TPA: response regulator, partial [Burkholderiales bacterium]|nr:response regulator [Burkholderiales bacterium]
MSERVVYVVDDDDAVRSAVRLLFRTAELEVETFASAAAFLQHADLERRCCLLLDIRMHGMTGADLHDELLGRGVRAPVIFITGHGDIPMAVEAMKKGAYDFIEKPFD